MGIVGCGWFTPFYLKALANLKERISPVWVADPDERRAEDIGGRLGVRDIRDYREGLNEVDIVFIIAPHHLHHSIAIDCLSAGCHVLLEKPIALNVQQADEMILAAENNKRTLMVAYPHRYRRGVQLFRDIVCGERYGKLIMLDGLMDESLQGYSLGWIAKKETLGGGVFFSSSPHMLDVMMWIAGEPVSLSMVGCRGGLSMEGEDTACSIMKFRSGAIGVTRHTWVSPGSKIWYTMHAVCEKAHVTLTTTPLGDLVAEGAGCQWETRIFVGDQPDQVLFQSNEGLEIEPEITHFLDCIEARVVPQTDGLMARRMLQIIDLAYQKAEAEGSNV